MGPPYLRCVICESAEPTSGRVHTIYSGRLICQSEADALLAEPVERTQPPPPKCSHCGRFCVIVETAPEGESGDIFACRACDLACKCRFGVLVGDCPTHGYLVEP